MEVLRSNTEMLMTVLDVLVHDPLYKWALSPDDKQKRQPTEGTVALVAGTGEGGGVAASGVGGAGGGGLRPSASAFNAAQGQGRISRSTSGSADGAGAAGGGGAGGDEQQIAAVAQDSLPPVALGPAAPAASDISGNVEAQRILFQLKAKLQGTEDDDSLSVRGQVNKLIHEARDPKFLCTIYHGSVLVLSFALHEIILVSSLMLLCCVCRWVPWV